LLAAAVVSSMNKKISNILALLAAAEVGSMTVNIINRTELPFQKYD